MRFSLSKKISRTPLDEIDMHSKKIKECTWAFQQAMECYSNKQCESLEEYHQDVIRLANESRAIKEQIHAHISGLKRSKINIHLLLSYLKYQSCVVDSVEQALEWMSFKPDFTIPQNIEKDFFLLIDSVIEPVEELVKLHEEARSLMTSHSAKHRKAVLKTIGDISRLGQDARRMEDRMKRKIFSGTQDMLTVFHLIRLADTIGSVPRHAESASDIIRAIAQA